MTSTVTGIPGYWAKALASALPVLGGAYAYAALKQKKEEKKMMSELETALLNVLEPLVDALHEVEKDVEMWKKECEKAQRQEEHMTKECEKRDTRIVKLQEEVNALTTTVGNAEMAVLNANAQINALQNASKR